MFTFADTPVKFIGLLVLFAWCTVWSTYELTRPQSTSQRVSNALHLVMSLVMLAMVPTFAWKGLTGVIPTWGLVSLFAASTAWFVALFLARRTNDKGAARHYAGHSMMFGAMTWHLAAMATMASAMAATMMPEEGMEHGGHGGGHGAGDMMGAMDAMSAQGGVLWWFAVVGLIFMTYLLVASVLALYRAVRPTGGNAVAETSSCCAEVRPTGSTKFRLAALSDFAMNFGMFWMSTGLMVPILPFFAAF